MNETAKEKDAVLGVFASTLRPLIGLALKYGISAADIARHLKGVYVQELERVLTEQRRPVTTPRLAIMAGLSGSDVSSLRADAAPRDANAGVSQERIAHLLTQWAAKLAGAYGVPRDLSVARVEGRPSFADLVELAFPGGEVSDDVLLDALVAAKSVEVVDGDVRCLSQAYVTKAPDANRIEQAGRFTGFVISTLAHNLLRGDEDPSYFERNVLSDERLNEAGRDYLLAMVGKRGLEVLFEIDTALAQIDPSMKSTTGKRYGMGIYVFEDPLSDEPANANTEDRLTRPSAESIATEPQEIDVLSAAFAKKS